MQKTEDMTRVEVLAYDALTFRGILPYTELIEAMVSFEAESRHESFMGLKNSLDKRREEYEQKMRDLGKDFTLEELQQLILALTDVRQNLTDGSILREKIFQMAKQKYKDTR